MWAVLIPRVRRILINLLFDTVPEPRQTTQTVWACLLVTTAVGIFSLITAGKIRAAFAGTDFNLAQEITSTIRAGVLEGLLLFSLIEPGFGETVLVSFWLIFQCMTDSHLSPLRWSHLVKVTMTGSDVRPWSTSLALEHLSAARQGKAGHASSCLCFQSLFQGGLGREPTVDHPHGRLNATMIPGVSMNLPGGGARGGIWQVLRHPCLVHKGL